MEQHWEILWACCLVHQREHCWGHHLGWRKDFHLGLHWGLLWGCCSVNQMDQRWEKSLARS